MPRAASGRSPWAQPAPPEGGPARLPAAPGHPPGTAHFPAAAPSPPSAPSGPGRGRRPGGGGQCALSPGNPLSRTRPRSPHSPQWEVVEVGRPAGAGRGVRVGGGAPGRPRGPRGRTAALGRPGFRSCACRSSPRSTPAGTSGFADWLMCPWKWLFKKLSQAGKMVMVPHSKLCGPPLASPSGAVGRLQKKPSNSQCYQHNPPLARGCGNLPGKVRWCFKKRKLY